MDAGHSRFFSPVPYAARFIAGQKSRSGLRLLQATHKALELRGFLQQLSSHVNQVVCLLTRKTKGGGEGEEVGLSILIVQTLEIDIHDVALNILLKPSR
jgi:hypothetical protein